MRPHPVKRLTFAQVEEYRKKNLCFKCDEKFVPSHKHNNRSLMVIEGNHKEEEDDEILLKPKEKQ